MSKKLQNKKKFQKSQKNEEGGDAKHVSFFTRSKRLFWPKYAVLIPNISQFVQKTYIITNI